MIENVEDLSAELHVESLRDSLDVIVLEQREVQRSDSRAYQNIASRVSAKVETGQGREPRRAVKSRILRAVDRNLVASSVDQTGLHRVAVRIPEGEVWCGRNLEACW